MVLCSVHLSRNPAQWRYHISDVFKHNVPLGNTLYTSSRIVNGLDMDTILWVFHGRGRHGHSFGGVVITTASWSDRETMTSEAVSVSEGNRSATLDGRTAVCRLVCASDSHFTSWGAAEVPRHASRARRLFDSYKAWNKTYSSWLLIVDPVIIILVLLLMSKASVLAASVELSPVSPSRLFWLMSVGVKSVE